MASSLRRSQAKQLRRVQNVRLGWRTVSVLGQFTRSHQKEGSFQVFCIQVTPETFCSHSFSSRYIQGHRIWDGNQHYIRCNSSAFEHQSQATTSSSCDCHHVCRSSLRADEVVDFHISGCMSGPHSKSLTVVLQIFPLWDWTSWRKGLLNLQERHSEASQWNTVQGQKPKRQVTTSQ